MRDKVREIQDGLVGQHEDKVRLWRGVEAERVAKGKGVSRVKKEQQYQARNEHAPKVWAPVHPSTDCSSCCWQQVHLGVHGFHERYYATKFGDSTTPSDVAKAYVEGLLWVMKYYYEVGVAAVPGVVVVRAGGSGVAVVEGGNSSWYSLRQSKSKLGGTC